MTVNLDADAVLNFLGDPATHGGKTVRRCDTHAAMVFLAGDRALKIKRAVRYPFLDYSTLEKRKAACLAELDVNRKFAPQLYRRIVPITREADGSLALDGGGEAIEWAVEMTRFDENMTLDHVADHGRFDGALAVRLAASVAAMHRRAEPVPADVWLDAVRDFVRDNVAAFGKRSDLFPRPSVEALDRASIAAFGRLRPLLEARGRDGLVRRGHGDLHLGNIALLEGEPVAFDALEFDPVIASGDVLYDLAFLLMDLVERNLNVAANQVLNSYFLASRRIEDYDGIAALPFFMSLRAAIRAKVTAARLELSQAGDNSAIRASARRYFDLALELLNSVNPVVVCIGGLSGTGKSLLARSLAPELAPKPGALVFRSDVERKARRGVGETERLPLEAYRPEVTQEVYGILTDKASRVARAGHSVIVDAVFARREERAAIETVVVGSGCSFCGLFLAADLGTRLTRIGARGPDASDADAELARKQEEYAIGTIDWPVIDATGSPGQTLTKAREAIGRAVSKPIDSGQCDGR
jgi:aminoglycoside phosphotransferase family enzyme/predicted kinase